MPAEHDAIISTARPGISEVGQGKNRLQLLLLHMAFSHARQVPKLCADVQGHPPFKCAVMVGGAQPGASVAETVMASSGRMQTPSVHIIGDADYVKPVRCT